jgi:alanyl-tRNA synthetase
MEISSDEFKIPFFLENDFLRKRCVSCGSYFWTQDLKRERCGDSPCEEYTFIKNSPAKKSLDLTETRETFLRFFNKRNHEIIRPYPVVARWRDDLYVTIASIVDFQPYVTDGYIPPPANPLVISQPCLRFEDIDNVGPTAGRHLTVFEMGGAHAFNYPDKKIYWKDETVRLHHELATKELGIPSSLVTYKEHFWSGGGNAGPDVEAMVSGLEISTLVFMMYKNLRGKLSRTNIETVDTGYGMERWSWLSQGTVSGFHAVFGSLLDILFQISGITNLDEKILIENAKLSGMANIEKLSDKMVFRKMVARRLDMDAVELDRILTPVENMWAVADHTKALILMLAEGIVPSNVKEGYLARLLLRRTYRLLRPLGIEDKLMDIVDLQINHWAKDFPQVKEMREEIIKALDVEKEKYQITLRRGVEIVRNVSTALKERQETAMPLNKLVEFYESNGITPNIVQEISEKIGVTVSIPDDFYARIVKSHIVTPQKEEAEGAVTKILEERVQTFPPTRTLFYEDVSIKEFKANLLKVIEGRYLVLDQTAFYPEGGGQPSDHGVIISPVGEAEIVDTQKVGKVILHEAKGQLPVECIQVTGKIDWSRRLSFMRHHTSTHLILGAARRVLGQHVWQAGAQKGAERSRIDITHYERIYPDELKKIELLANRVVFENIPIDVKLIPREEAERKYGFRLYQGGVVPGREIRVVKIGDWDVEACGGTHCRTTGEVGFIKILEADRIQDGVERLIFASGEAALKLIQERDDSIRRAAEALNSTPENFAEEAKKLSSEYKDTRKELTKTSNELALYKSSDLLSTAKDIEGVRVVSSEYKGLDPSQLIAIANGLVAKDPSLLIALSTVSDTVRIVVMAGRNAVKKGVDAGKIAGEISFALGGSGGGTPNFGQGGGTNLKEASKALRIVEGSLQKQLK